MPMTKLKASDTLHISSVKSDPIRPGETFELEANDARSLVRRGLATEVRAARPPRPKAASASKNKKASEPENKGAVAGA